MMVASAPVSTSAMTSTRFTCEGFEILYEGGEFQFFKIDAGKFTTRLL